jgi:hypothetical protein
VLDDDVGVRGGLGWMYVRLRFRFQVWGWERCYDITVWRMCVGKSKVGFKVDALGSKRRSAVFQAGELVGSLSGGLWYQDSGLLKFFGDVVWWRWWRGLGSWWVVVMLIEEDDTLEVKSGVWLKGSSINRQKQCMACENE